MLLFPLLAPYLRATGPIGGVTMENPSVTVTVSMAGGRAFDFYSFDFDTKPMGVTSETINETVPERVREALEDGSYTFTFDSMGRTSVRFGSLDTEEVELDTPNGWLFAGAMGIILENLLHGLHEALVCVTPWPALRAQIAVQVWEQVSRHLAAGLPLPQPSEYQFEVLEPIGVMRNAIANGPAPTTSILVAMPVACRTPYSEIIYRLYGCAVEKLGPKVARQVTKIAKSQKHGVDPNIRSAVLRRSNRRRSRQISKLLSGLSVGTGDRTERLLAWHLIEIDHQPNFLQNGSLLVPGESRG